MHAPSPPLPTRPSHLQEAATFVDPKTFPPILDTDDTPRKKFDGYYKVPTPELIAYLDFSVSTTGVLSGIKVGRACVEGESVCEPCVSEAHRPSSSPLLPQVSHASLRSLCRSLKYSSELFASREIVLCCDPYSGLGLALWCAAR